MEVNSQSEKSSQRRPRKNLVRRELVRVREANASKAVIRVARATRARRELLMATGRSSLEMTEALKSKLLGRKGSRKSHLRRRANNSRRKISLSLLQS